jgi:hypothetical protein
MIILSHTVLWFPTGFQCAKRRVDTAAAWLLQSTFGMDALISSIPKHALSGSSPVNQGTHVFEAVTHGTRWTSTALVQAGGVFPAEPALTTHLRRAIETSMAEAKALLERRMVDHTR